MNLTSKIAAFVLAVVFFGGITTALLLGGGYTWRQVFIVWGGSIGGAALIISLAGIAVTGTVKFWKELF